MTEQERFEAWLETQDYFEFEDGVKYLDFLEFNEKENLYHYKTEHYLSRSFETECINITAPAINGAWLAWQAAQQKWISVADRLPDIGVSVMAGAYKGGEFYWHFYERYEEDGFWMWSRHESDLGSDCEADDYTITHWQPLPEPPKEPT